MSNQDENGLRGFETLGKVLRDDGWDAELSEDVPHTYEVIYLGKHGRIFVHARVRPDVQLLLLYGLPPFEVEAELRLATAEFITRANYGMRVGNFELNFDSGQLRYKSSIDFRDTELTSELIRNAIIPCTLTMDRYLPALKALLKQGKSVQEALALVENPAA